MTITFTLPQSGNNGPGEFVSWSSDFIGPITSTTFWGVNYYADSAGTLFYVETDFNAEGLTSSGCSLFTIPTGNWNINDANVPVNGATTRMRVQLIQPPATLLDQGFVTAPWSSVEALAQMIYRLNTGASPDVSEILAAVKKTFPTT